MKLIATHLLAALIGAILSQLVQYPPRSADEVREVVARAFGGGLQRCYAVKGGKGVNGGGDGGDAIICGDSFAIGGGGGGSK